jgi:hydrogenase maturation protease
LSDAARQPCGSPLPDDKSTAPSVLAFGYGNPSRGDDALGPLLLQALQAKGGQSDRIEFLTDFQLQIEHALDLDQRRLVLFADCHVACPSPFAFSRLAEARDDSYTTHAMSPSAILHVYRRIRAAAPPPCFLLSIRGERFELGEALSPQAQDHLVAAVEFAKDLLETPDLAYWETKTGEVNRSHN